MTPDAWSDSRLTVLYDADCGICTMTARMLHALDWRRRLRLVALQRFVRSDPSDPGDAVLATRLHARGRDGRWLSGGDAALRIADSLPALVSLALLGRLPGAGPLVERGYHWVATHRDTIGRMLGVDRCRIDPARLDS